MVWTASILLLVSSILAERLLAKSSILLLVSSILLFVSSILAESDLTTSSILAESVLAISSAHMTLPVSVSLWSGESVLLWGVGACMVVICVVGIIGAGSGYED